MRRATAMLVLLGAMILAVVLAGRQWQRRSAGAHVERAAAGLRANVGEVRFQNVAFKAALAELGERAGLRIVPRWDVLGRTGIGPETTISLDVPRGSARAALNDLLDCATASRVQLQSFVDEHGTVVVTTDADARTAAMVSRSYDVSALVPRGGDALAVRRTLAVVVGQSIHASGGAGDAACDLVADRLAVVADREQQLRVERLLSDCASPDLQTRTRLASRTIARWMIDDQPLRNTLDRLARESGIAIEPDWPALQEMGVEPESTVTVRARNLSAAKLLGVILENVVWRRGREGPAWYVRTDGSIVVTSPAQIDQRFTSVCMYDLYPYVARARLAGRERQIVEAVVSLIHDTVATNTWESGTGEAWIRCDSTRLYIRQAADRHRQIASLLEQLLETSHVHFRGSEEVPADSDLIPPRTTAR